MALPHSSPISSWPSTSPDAVPPMPGQVSSVSREGRLPLFYFAGTNIHSGLVFAIIGMEMRRWVLTRSEVHPYDDPVKHRNGRNGPLLSKRACTHQGAWILLHNESVEKPASFSSGLPRSGFFAFDFHSDSLPALRYLLYRSDGAIASSSAQQTLPARGISPPFYPATTSPYRCTLSSCVRCRRGATAL